MSLSPTVPPPIPPPAPLNPGLGLVVCGFTVISLCMAIVSFAIGAVVASRESCFFCSLVCTLPIPLTIGVFEYLAVFRQRATFAMASAALLVFPMALLFWGGMEVAVAVSKRDFEFAEWSLISLLALFGGALFFGTAALLNYRWGRRLFANPEAQLAAAAFRRRFTLREMFIAMTVLAIMAAIGGGIVRSVAPASAYIEHVASNQVPLALPTAASDVCYASRRNQFTRCEFAIDEPSFVAWMNAAQRTIVPIATPQTIDRYSSAMPNSPNPPLATVQQGLSYSGMEGGRTVTILFDRAAGRAYYVED